MGNVAAAFEQVGAVAQIKEEMARWDNQRRIAEVRLQPVLRSKAVLHVVRSLGLKQLMLELSNADFLRPSD